MSHSSRRTSEAKNKARKPYVITKQREPWTDSEHELFLEALSLYERDWKKIAEYVKNKTVKQLRSHAQKHFLKINKTSKGEDLPKPIKRSRYEPPQLRESTNTTAPADDAGSSSAVVPCAYEHAGSQDSEESMNVKGAGISEELLRKANIAAFMLAQLDLSTMRKKLLNALTYANEEQFMENRARSVNQDSDERDASLMAWFREQMERTLKPNGSYTPSHSTVLERLSDTFGAARLAYQRTMIDLDPELRMELERLVQGSVNLQRPVPRLREEDSNTSFTDTPQQSPDMTNISSSPLSSSTSSPISPFSYDASSMITPPARNPFDGDAYKFDFNAAAELLSDFPVMPMPQAPVTSFGSFDFMHDRELLPEPPSFLNAEPSCPPIVDPSYFLDLSSAYFV